MPLSKGRGLGLSWSTIGFDLYRENQLTLGVGMLLSDKFAIGIGLDYLNTRFRSDYGQSHKGLASLGLLFNFTPKLRVGVEISNVNRARLLESEYLPVGIKMGVDYEFSKIFFLGVQLNKQIRYPPSLHLGMEYKVGEELVLRLGIASAPWSYSFGLAYQFKNIQLGLSSSFHPVLGITPGLSLGYSGFP